MYTRVAPASPERFGRIEQRPSRILRQSTAIVFCLTPLILCLPWAVQIPSALNAFLAVAGLATVGLSLAVSVSTRFRPMLALSSAFLMCWMFVPAIYQLATGRAAWSDAQVLFSGENVTLALLLNLLTQVALLSGYLWREHRRSTKHDAVAGTRGSGREQMPLAPGFGRLLVVASIAMLPFVASKKGGLNVLFMPRDVQGYFADAALNVAVNGGLMQAIVEYVPYSLSVAGTLLILLSIRSQPKSNFPSWAFLLAGVVMTWVYANPIANTRFIALSCLGSIALVAFRPRSHGAGRLIITTFIAFTLLLYPLTSAISSSTGLTRTAQAVTQDPFVALSSQDFDGFQQTINAFEYVQDQGPGWGIYTISALLVVIPRAVWPAKATPASIDVASNHGYSFTNLSLATNAEIYIDFGWIGIVVLFTLAGALYSYLDALWESSVNAYALVGFLSVAQIGLIRGPMGSNVPPFVFTLMLLLFGMVLAKRHKRRTTRNAEQFRLSRRSQPNK